MSVFLNNMKREISLIVRGMKVIHRVQPWLILVSIGYGVFSSVLPFVTIYFSSLIINELGSPSRDFKHVIRLVILALILNLVCRLIVNFLAQMFDTLQYVLGHKNQLDLADKGYRLDYADMDDTNIRQMREKLNRGRYYRGIVAIAFQLNALTLNLFSVVISISLMVEMFLTKSTGTSTLDILMNSPIAGMLLIALLVISILYSIKVNTISQKKQFEAMNQSGIHFNYDRFYTYQLSTEYNVGKDIRLYGQKPLIENQINFHLNKILEFQKSVPEFAVKYGTIGSGIQVIVNVATYLFVGIKALLGAFEVGNIVLYTGAITQFGQGFTGVMQTLSNIKQNTDYLQWYFDFVDLPNRKESGTHSIDLETVKNGIIEFKNVSFKYPGSDHYSLENISIRFNVGERVAVVGKNGSGKTTFIKLLCRLYDPTEGEILLNGMNIKEYSYQDYLAIFSVVFQDFNLFSFTLGENIAISSDYDEEKVMDCANRAGLEKRMEAFPDGLHTQLYNEISEEGVEISGGEAQKIAIARALYKDAPFIILDEPTAALDPLAEADIYARLNRDLIQNKTAIYISHRLSSCCFCNQIAVFDQGRLIQHGTHKDLLEMEDGLYHELWNAQAQYYA